MALVTAAPPGVASIGTPTDGTTNVVGSASLESGLLTFAPDPDFSGTAFIPFTTVAGATGVLQVVVAPVADAPILAVAPASAPEGGDVPLDITALLQDTEFI